jgi:hypothetical protein
VSVYSGCTSPNPQLDKGLSAAIQKSAPFQTEKKSSVKIEGQNSNIGLAIVSFLPTTNYQVLFQVLEDLQKQILNC